MNKIIKNLALKVPYIKKYYNDINNLRKENETLHCNYKKQISNLNIENEILNNKIDELNLLNEYYHFRAEYPKEELPELALFRTKYPHGEITVIYDNNINISREKQLTNFCNKEDFFLSIFNNIFVLSSRKPLIDRDGVTYIFNGITIWKDKFIFGDDDIIMHNIKTCELKEGIGEFELLTFNNNQLELSTDFFGMCQLYYYKSDNGIFVSSTSYHILLKILNIFKIKMKLNIKKVSAGMAFFNPFSQSSFTSEMDVENCFELPPDKKIKFNNMELVFENTSLYNEVHNPEEYSDVAYEKYINKGKDEIISNIKAIFEHPKFKYILCDLSGGVDSRMVIAGAMNLPSYLKEKIKITSSVNKINDFKIASGILNLFELHWSDLPKTMSYNDIGIQDGKLKQVPQSYNLGTYYSSNYMPNSSFLENTIQLTGGCGEIISRNTCSMFDFSLDDEKFLDSILLYQQGDIKSDTKAGNYLKEYLRKNILNMQIKGKDNKTDIFYLYFRNRHHFKTKYKNIPAWTPLQSKTAFHCKRMYFQKHVDGKIQYDLMTLLNPILANFPYENFENNGGHNNYLKILSERLLNFVKIEVKPDFEIKNYPKEKINYLPDKETVDKINNLTKIFYTSEKTLLSALKTFLDYSEEFNELGLPMFQYFTKDRFHNKYGYHLQAENMRINRILSVYWQIKYLEE